MSESGLPPTQHFTAVMPIRLLLPPDLAVLLAPVRSDVPGAPDADAGRAEGVLLDDGGRVVAFILRLASRLDERSARTLVPATAMSLRDGPVLGLAWTEEHLCARPRLDQDLQPKDPVESQRLAAPPGLAAPGPGASGGEAAKEGVEGGVLGAALGAVAGLVLGGPIAAVSLAAFFAVGGGIGGLISGAADEKAPEPAPDETEMKLSPLQTWNHGALAVALQRLEARLRLSTDPELAELVRITEIMPVTTVVEPPGQAAA